MANVFLLALGSRGDVQPVLALAIGLKSAGHEVVLATPMGFEDLVGGRGLTHVEVTDNPAVAVLNHPDEDLIKTAKRHPLREGRRLLSDYFAKMEAVMDAIPAASKDADLVFWWEPLAGFGRHIAEALGVPGVSGSLSPDQMPTSTVAEPLPRPPSWLPPSVRATYIRLGHAAHLQLVTSLYRSRVNRWRRDLLGLAELPRRASLAEKVAAPALRLSEVSPLVRDLPPEWQGSVVTTGYWTMPPGDEWTMPENLRAFLDDGEAPVFASVGTALNFPAKLGPMIVEAARRAGVRLVLSSGWHRAGGLDTGNLPPHVIEVGTVPYENVFPSMTGVIHTGGCGVTAEALRAGVPSVAMPVFADQPYWGRRIAELGVGPAPLSPRKVTVDQLTAAMRRFRDDESMRNKAAALGALLRAEDGVATAVQAIEALLPDELVPRRSETLLRQSELSSSHPSKDRRTHVSHPPGGRERRLKDRRTHVSHPPGGRERRLKDRRTHVSHPPGGTERRLVDSR